MASAGVVCVALLALAVAAAVAHIDGGVRTFEKRRVDLLPVDVEPHVPLDAKPHVPLVRLFQLMNLRDDDDEHTKLERMLINKILSFRDKLSKPQPDLGLPALDPFDYTPDKPLVVNNPMANINANLHSVSSQGVSKFKVDNLSVYLVERLGVLDIKLPNFSIGFNLAVAAGSWLSPLKVPFNDDITVKFSSPEITLGLRGKVAVQDSRLSMESTKIALDLGKWSLEILPGRSTGTFNQNTGLALVLADVVKSLAPRLIEDWTPVLEKYVNDSLDEKLQDLQISDIINQLDS
ncbi:uncharacterized protein LOC117649651 [Thrips palmi]|uniref:Uncharacterized protein LOC117649651 n=1 Tax=Thrips palmi TaxID=161013 RepID=A0A6P8ZTR2_THRPL|nr:uncharacterized protein LOC117649651 [Thrips palmi]